jgi:O-antigen/teichoic acid export membrane protein
LALTAGTVLSQAIQVIATPILGRLYSPSAFGIWSLLQSAAAIPAAVGGFRYELALTLSESDEEAISVGALQVFCLLLTTFLTAVAVFCWPSHLAAAVGTREYQIWLWALPAIVFAQAFTLNANYWNIRRKQFLGLARYRTTQTLGIALAQGASWPLWRGPQGLIAGGVLGLFAPAIVFLIAFWRQDRKLMRAVAPSKMWRAARKFSNFPRYVVPFGLVSVVRDRGIYLLLGIYATVHITGLYSTAIRLAYAPVQLIASSFSPIVYRRACEHAPVSAAAPMVYRVLKAITLCTAPLFIVIGWFARDAFAFLMGQRWREAGVYAGILAIPASLQVLSGPLERMLDIVSHQKVALVIELCYSVMTLSIVGYAFAVGKGAPLCISFFAAVTIFYHVALVSAVYHFCEFPARDLAKVASLYLALTCGTLLILFAVTRHTPWN